MGGGQQVSYHYSNTSLIRAGGQRFGMASTEIGNHARRIEPVANGVEDLPVDNSSDRDG